MKKSRFAIVLSLALVFGLCSCISAGEKKIRIGLCMASLDTFLSSMADAAVARAAEIPGVEMTLMDAQDDSVRQTDQANTFLNDVDVLIVNVVETSAAQPIVDQAARVNKPVVWVNRNPFFGKEVPPNNYVISSNSLLEGANGMEYAGKLMGGKGNIIILQGTLGHEAATNRTEGVRMVIREKYPDIKILAEETGNWFRDQGMTVTENLITSFGDQINAVLSNNDEMALGALLALQINGMNDVIVVGVDGTNDGITSVANGGLAATAYQDPVAQGAGAVDIAIRVVNGEKVEALNRLPVEVVTKDNVEEFQKRIGK
ncbi:MAG: substrate-binding domain-containing protein [Planctomycetaceae bacterium]|nr:substrate-binding domain-containing protein [Planctomycetaceae bacterium]